MRVIVHRPARTSSPVTPPEAQAIAAPPQLPEGQTGGFPIQALLPVLGAVSSMTMMMISRGSNPAFLVVGALVFVVALASGLAMAFTSRGRATRTRQQGRERYLDYLEDLRASLTQQADQARSALAHTDPDPVMLPQLIADPARLWERRPGDPDFLRVRIGAGTLSWITLTTPRDPNPVQPLDPLLLGEAELTSRTASLVDDLPIWVDLRQGGEIAIIGEREATTNLVRALLAHTVVFHPPEQVRIGAVFDPGHTQEWTGFGHLPHTLASIDPTGIPHTLVAPTLQTMAHLLADDLTARIRRVATQRHGASPDHPPGSIPHLIVIIDEHGHPAQRFPIPEEGYTCADLAITAIHLINDRLDEPSDLATRITTTPTGAITVDHLTHTPASTVTGQADLVSPALFETIAHDLTPLALSTADTDQASGQPDTISALRLLGIPDITQLSPATAWQPRSSRDFLRVPIGVDDHGAPLLLDLKEAAQLGMGPHGICVGATGSGKSELLRTLVLSLAITHSPEDLSMILVDYKGGAAFAPFTRLAHVAGLIDNLADDPQLTRRARESIAGEVQRRQTLLKNTDSAPSIGHYRQLRLTNPTLAPLPHLLIIIDEFGELLTAEPEFADLLLKIGRIGRSIGVHLLLASQRLESGMLHGLDTYLSYWIGMRTFSEAESRTILGTPDAFTLPNQPGYAYLKVDTSVYTRFKAGYVSGPVPDPTSPDNQPPPDHRDPSPLVHTVALFDPPAHAATSIAEEQLAPPETTHGLVDEAVTRLTTPLATTPVWLAPLPTRITLGAVLTNQTLTQAAHSLQAPIGLLDDPAHQAQAPWMLDLGAHGGHVAIVGGPQTGRSTFLRTIAVSLALTHTPTQVSIYGVDLTGGGLERIEGFPHVGGVATRTDKTRLQRLLEELHQMIAQRETIFHTRHIDSITALRHLHTRQPIPELVAPDVIILVDGLEPLRNEYEQLDQPFTDLLQRGATFGLHVILALTRWNELRTTLQPLIGQHLELRLNDPGESSIQRAAAQALKTASPGRVLTPDLRYGQIALPILDDTDDDTSIGDTIASLAHHTATSWSGPAAAPIRLLPDNLDPASLPDRFDYPDTIPIGLAQASFQPFCYDPTIDQHLLIFGDTQCGKTTALTGIIQGLINRYTPDQLVFAIIDPRSQIAHHIPDPYLGGQATSAPQAHDLTTAVAHELHQRDTTTGGYPRVVVVVDDYDIIAAGATHPLAPLLAHLPSARDLQLTILLTRPVAGIGRALFDPAIQALRDTGASGLVMSGEHAEGPVYPKIYAEPSPPGRGHYIRRGTPARLIHIAHFTWEPPHAP